MENTLQKIIDGLLDYDDQRFVHVWGMVRELHRNRQPTQEDIEKIIDFVYDRERKTQ